MEDSDKEHKGRDSAEKQIPTDFELYRKLKVLKSKLDINLEMPKNEPYDYIFIAVHGIGTTESMLENDYKNLKNSMEFVRKYWFYNQNLKIHLRFINWKKYIVDAQNTLFDNVAIDTAKGMRKVFTLAVLDVTFYLNPRFSDYLITNVANDLNNEITTLRNHPNGLFKKAKIVVLAYSMGSVILDELIRTNPDKLSNIDPSKRPVLEHKIDYFFAIGSPLSCVLEFYSPQILKTGLRFPDTPRYYNVFHPYDPIACRWEKLIYRHVNKIPKPVIAPYWQNNGFKNWYNIDQQFQYCKSLIVDNLSDVANTITKGLTSWLGSSQNSVLNQNITNSLNRKKSFNNFRNKLMRKDEVKVVDTEEVIKDSERSTAEQQKYENEFFSDFEVDDSSCSALERLNLSTELPVRYDYQLQEDATEHFLNPLAILQSHISYWGSRDVSFFILKEVHKKKESVPITSLLTYIESKGKSLAMSTTDEALKKELLGVSEKAKKLLDQISKEDIKFKNDSVIALKNTWNLMNKSGDEDDDQPYESLISDNIEDSSVPAK